MTTALNKPHLKLTGKAVWQCADAHVSRRGRNWKQAYDRWLLASLRDAANKALAGQPKGKRRGKPRREIKPMGWYVEETTKAANPLDLASALEHAGLQMPPARPPEPAKPVVKAIKAEPIKQPDYPESMVQQIAGTHSRPAYQPSLGLLRNIERAAAHQQPLISISTGQEQ